MRVWSRPAITQQTWTALVAAVVFVGLGLALALVPVPFVSWSPGGARDVLGAIDGQPVITVEGATTYPTTGRLDMTVVSATSVDGRLTLPQALWAFWREGHDALPRSSVYRPDQTDQQVETEEAELMETAQDDAVVAALRAAGQPVRELPAVTSVVVDGPAHDRLRPGDLVLSVDGVATPTADAVGREIRSHPVGSRVALVVERAGARTRVEVTSVASPAQAGRPYVGITLGTGYRYDPRISFDLGRKIGGPSAGLVFALAIYDLVTPGALLAGAHVAGTGTINPDGQVGPIGGLQEKITSAQDAGATAFLVPAANCGDLAGVDTSMNLIKVATLRAAVDALTALASPGGADRLPRCP